MISLYNVFFFKYDILQKWRLLIFKHDSNVEYLDSQKYKQKTRLENKTHKNAIAKRTDYEKKY